MEQQNKPTTTVKSADRVLDIFELFAAEQEPMNLVEISRKLDMPVSSTYKILQNLLMRGYLETDKNEKMFKLGYKILEIATRYVQNTDLITEFHYISQRIVDDINEAVFLSIRNDDKILYVAEKQSTHPVRFVSHRGMKLPLHSTAMGKALLSSLSEDEITALYPSEEMGKLTDSTITDRSALFGQLEQIRTEGLSFSYGESVQGIQCVAAPIFNSEGKAVAAMSVSIPATRVEDDLWRRAQDWVRQGAKELSLNLYHQGDDRL